MGFVYLAIIVLLIVLAVRRFRRRKQRAAAKYNTALVANQVSQAGGSHAQRAPAIEAAFEDRTATLSASHTASWTRRSERDEGGLGHRMAYSDPSRQPPVVKAEVTFTVSRNLAGMERRELAYLKTAELLNSLANGAEAAFRNWRTALIWGDGKGTIDYFDSKNAGLAHHTTALDLVREAIQRGGLSVEQTMNAMQQYSARTLAAANTSPDYRAVLMGLTDAITPAGSASWLKSSQLEGSPFGSRSPYRLHIGSFPDGTPLTYSGDGSMVTIAPPGSGKTQCNVFPNLLTWTGPAVVLDISGDIYEHTGAWRAANVGPVYRFSPLEPEASHHYNPLTFVRSDSDYIWEDSRLLAEMMIVPSNASDQFWENEARTVLTAAIAHVTYANPPDQRPMHAVLDVLFGGAAWDEMITGLRLAVDVRVMTQHATSLSSMNEKTLSSVLQTARSSLGAWSGERIARATAKSDWSPEDLRAGTNPTIYICIRPNEVEAYLSLLRVFIGQHIRTLTGGAVPPPGSPPILFMLDELPRLRNMPPVDEALNIGRKYGLRLWLFAQSVGQLQTAYENADGMLGSCAIRIFMNPSGADGVAERVSEELGYVESINDGNRRRLVEAAELAGPGYRDRQIVLANGAKPATVSKDFAFQSPALAERMTAGGPG